MNRKGVKEQVREGERDRQNEGGVGRKRNIEGGEGRRERARWQERGSEGG